MKVTLSIIVASLWLICFDAKALSIEVTHKSLGTGERSDIVYVEPVLMVNSEDLDHLVAATISLPIENTQDWWNNWRFKVFVSTDAGNQWKSVSLSDMNRVSGNLWLYWDESGDLYLSILARNKHRPGWKLLYQLS